MGVGPSVPYWTGASSAGTNVNGPRRSHHVVRIPVDDSLSTLSFGADASALNGAIRAGYDATWEGLRLLSGATPQGQPVEVDPSANRRSPIAALRAAVTRLRRSWSAWRERNPDLRQAANIFGWIMFAPFRLMMHRSVRRMVVHYGWLVVPMFLTAEAVNLVDADSDLQRLSQLVSVALALAVLLWGYAAARSRNARQPWTLLRRQSPRRLTVVAGISFVIGAATILAFSVGDAVSLGDIVTTERVPGTISTVHPEEESVSITIDTAADTAECPASFRRTRKVDTSRELQRGDDVQMRFDPDRCRWWAPWELTQNVRNAISIYLVAVGLLTLSGNCLIAIRWRHHYLRNTRSDAPSAE